MWMLEEADWSDEGREMRRFSERIATSDEEEVLSYLLDSTSCKIENHLEARVRARVSFVLKEFERDEIFLSLSCRVDVLDLDA